MKSKAIKVMGGPQDGLQNIMLEQPLPDHWVHTEANGTESIYVRRETTTYGPHPYDFKEIRSVEEVRKMGFKKHGTGQVLPDDQPEQKTASDQEDWGQADEKALDEEVKGE